MQIRYKKGADTKKHKCLVEHSINQNANKIDKSEFVVHLYKIGEVVGSYPHSLSLLSKYSENLKFIWNLEVYSYSLELS